MSSNKTLKMRVGAMLRGAPSSNTKTPRMNPVVISTVTPERRRRPFQPTGLTTLSSRGRSSRLSSARRSSVGSIHGGSLSRSRSHSRSMLQPHRQINSILQHYQRQRSVLSNFVKNHASTSTQLKRASSTISHESKSQRKWREEY